MIARRAGALRREQQEKRRTNAPPSRKPDAPLGSLSSVALSCCISKATTLYNPFDGNVNSVTLLRHRLSTLRGAVHYLRSRYYNPVVGRFVNADTQMGWTSLMGKNMYLYCMNAPSLLSDSNGFSPVIEPRSSRPENWDADYRAEFRRERMQALVRKAAKAVMQAVRNVNLYRMVLQLANHGGGVIKFKSGSKATCYTRVCSHYLQ